MLSSKTRQKEVSVFTFSVSCIEAASAGGGGGGGGGGRWGWCLCLCVWGVRGVVDRQPYDFQSLQEMQGFSFACDFPTFIRLKTQTLRT